MNRVRIDARSLHALAEHLDEASRQHLMDSQHVAEWADVTAAIMAEEVPYDTGEMSESITVEMSGTTATVGPTNRDDQGRPIAHFHQYGYRGKQPNDFLGRTARRAVEEAWRLPWLEGLL